MFGVMDQPKATEYASPKNWKIKNITYIKTLTLQPSRSSEAANAVPETPAGIVGTSMWVSLTVSFASTESTHLHITLVIASKCTIYQIRRHCYAKLILGHDYNVKSIIKRHLPSWQGTHFNSNPAYSYPTQHVYVIKLTIKIVNSYE